MNRYNPPLTRWHLAAVFAILLQFMTSVKDYRSLKMALCLAVAAGYLALAAHEGRRTPLLSSIYVVFFLMWVLISYLRWLLDFA